jgi:ABC-type lipoprotein export system ATPase subunit
MISVQDLRHRYGASVGLALDEWRVEQGEHWLVLGPSGSGKSTLLHVLSGLLVPSEGRVAIAGQLLSELSGAALDRFRGRIVGIVPQKLHLIGSLSVEANLALAQYMAGLPRDRERVNALLASVGIRDKANARPHALSHGEAQRAAVARAVVNRPRLILADEPTSNLDDAHCTQALDLLETQARAVDATLVIATHDQRARARFGKQLVLGERPRTGPATPAAASSQSRPEGGLLERSP